MKKLSLMMALTALWLAACGADGPLPGGADAGLGADAMTADGAPSPDTSPGGTCGIQPRFPSCSSTSTTPSTRGEITAFLAKNAVPLTCTDARGQRRWELDALAQQLSAARLFIFGEVHGANEPGATSYALFEHLLRRKLVDALVLEVPMDFTDAYARFVSTGDTSALSYYYLYTVSPNDFRRGFAERLRALKLQGVSVPRAHGVDLPWRLAWVNEQIEALAKDKPSSVRKVLVDALPAPMEYLDKGIDLAYEAKARAYARKVWDNAATVCAPLTATSCARVKHLARALWLGAFMQSPAYAKASLQQMNEWKARREELMYHNYQRVFALGYKRAYAHMGASHAKKKTGSVARRLQDDLPATKGKVLTSMPVYGDGSKVAYGGSVFPLYTYPPIVGQALAKKGGPLLLSTRLPGEGCVGSPLAAPGLQGLVGTAGKYYDFYVWFQKLTPATTN